MNTTQNTYLKEMIRNLLDDDEGISSESYSSLLNYLAAIDENGLLEEVNNSVEANNGRYYFPVGVGQLNGPGLENKIIDTFISTQRKYG